MFIDSFIWKALFAGVGIAIIAGPLGCFVVWRRMAYFGDTMAHSGLLGIALGLLLGVGPIWGVLITGIVIVGLLVLLQHQNRIATDTLLGILAHASLSLGLVVIGLMPWLRIDLMGYLFGDILTVTKEDLFWIWGGGVLVLTVLTWLWRPLLAVTIHEDLARAEGINIISLHIAFMLLIAMVIAVSMKIVGILLITALSIIPAAAARRFAWSPESMAVLAGIIGIISVLSGIAASFYFDTPAGPSIVVAAMVMFILSQFPLPKAITSAR
ncbi:MAG: zinc ABC transporter permease subunit ZnuB [Alphaproteobacteria bacterium]